MHELWLLSDRRLFVGGFDAEQCVVWEISESTALGEMPLVLPHVVVKSQNHVSPLASVVESKLLGDHLHCSGMKVVPFSQLRAIRLPEAIASSIFTVGRRFFITSSAVCDAIGLAIPLLEDGFIDIRDRAGLSDAVRHYDIPFAANEDADKRVVAEFKYTPEWLLTCWTLHKQLTTALANMLPA